MFFKSFKNFKTKTILSLLSLFIMPASTLAYSEYLIPGGENIGIELNGKGVMVVGLYKVGDSYPGREASLNVGDIIQNVNGNNVTNITELIHAIQDKCDSAKLTYLRNNKVLESTLKLSKDENGVCKTGLYVKDKISGIGTLSFIDPNTKIFGALGHEIIEKTTGKILEIKDGKIYSSTVTGIDRSENGVPGEKNARLNANEITGTIDENTTQGIFGNYTDSLPNKEQKKIGNPDEIHTGKATLMTVLDGTEVKEYEINITKINNNMSQKNKNILFTITDEELLEKTGGIVQGMSGSPILQDDKIIATVTHVVVNDPTRGYGIFITNMLEEAEN